MAKPDRELVASKRELIDMANRGVPLRMAEVVLLTGVCRQTLEKIERRAIAKIVDLIPEAHDAMTPEHRPHTKRRGIFL